VTFLWQVSRPPLCSDTSERIFMQYKTKVGALGRFFRLLTVIIITVNFTPSAYSPRFRSRSLTSFIEITITLLTRK